MSSPSPAHYIFGGIALVVGIIAFFIARRSAKNTDMYSLYVEAASTHELAEGVPSFYSGTVVASQVLKTPYTGKDCVYYSYSVEREVPETDAQGNTTMQWQSLGGDKGGVAFVLTKGSEQVMVNPDSVDDVKGIESQTSILGTGVLSGLKLGGINLNIGMGITNGQERITEKFISPGTMLTVGGQLFSSNNMLTFQHDTHYPLVLTTKSKQDLVSSGKTTSYIGYGVAALGIIAGLLLILILKY